MKAEIIVCHKFLSIWIIIATFLLSCSDNAQSQDSTVSDGSYTHDVISLIKEKAPVGLYQFYLLEYEPELFLSDMKQRLESVRKIIVNQRGDSIGTSRKDTVKSLEYYKSNIDRYIDAKSYLKKTSGTIYAQCLIRYVGPIDELFELGYSLNISQKDSGYCSLTFPLQNLPRICEIQSVKYMSPAMELEKRKLPRRVKYFEVNRN